MNLRIILRCGGGQRSDWRGFKRMKELGKTGEPTLS